MFFFVHQSKTKCVAREVACVFKLGKRPRGRSELLSHHPWSEVGGGGWEGIPFQLYCLKHEREREREKERERERERGHKSRKQRSTAILGVGEGKANGTHMTGK